MQQKPKPGKLLPVLLFLLILLLSVCSLLWILSVRNKDTGNRYYADIYSEGKRMYCIPLWQITTPYTLEIVDSRGGRNELLLTPGEISVTNATCPDQLCVHQGSRSDSAAPIVCLPNRLVVQLRQADGQDEFPDIVTH